ncbi:hypothetical protein NSTCB13_01364 [Nostoc sp. DSM 114160]
MGQKIHPVGFRLGITHEHQSRWFAVPDRYPELLQEDHKLRQYIEQKLGRQAQNNAGISEVRIERKADQIDLEVRTARPWGSSGSWWTRYRIFAYRTPRIVG